MKHFFFLITSISYILIICFLNSGWNAESDISLYYVILATCSIFSCWYNSNKKLNLVLLYLITFHLFIGGRFFVCLFDNSLSPFQPTFFFNYNVSSQRVIGLMNYVYTFLYFVVFGHYFSKTIRFAPPIRLNSRYINQKTITSLSNYYIPILAVCLLFNAITSTIYVWQHGYAVLEYSVSDKAYGVSFVDKISTMLLVLILAMTFVYARDKIKNYLILYAAYGIVILIGGSRGAFGTILLLWVWIYSMINKVSLVRIGFYAMGGVAFLLVVFALSTRGTGLEGFTIFDALKIFIYDNGISLMVFDASRLVDNYPTLPYFQVFIPGVSYIYSIISSTTMYPQDITFEGYLCYSLNPSLYSNGAGLGWTTLSDVYIFSRGNIIFFSIFSSFIGSVLGYLESWAEKSNFYKYVVLAVAPGVFMMSRGTLASLFVQMVYAFFFYIVIHQYYKHKLSLPKSVRY